MILAEYWDRFQQSLFPHLVAVMEEPLTDKLEQLIRIWDVVRIEEHLLGSGGKWTGRPEIDRGALGRALVAKAVYNLATRGCWCRKILCSVA